MMLTATMLGTGKYQIQLAGAAANAVLELHFYNSLAPGTTNLTLQANASGVVPATNLVGEFGEHMCIEARVLSDVTPNKLYTFAYSSAPAKGAALQYVVVSTH